MHLNFQQKSSSQKNSEAKVEFLKRGEKKEAKMIFFPKCSIFYFIISHLKKKNQLIEKSCSQMENLILLTTLKKSSNFFFFPSPFFFSLF